MPHGTTLVSRVMCQGLSYTDMGRGAPRVRLGLIGLGRFGLG